MMKIEEEERENIYKVPENMPNMHVSYIIIIIKPLPTSILHMSGHTST